LSETKSGASLAATPDFAGAQSGLRSLQIENVFATPMPVAKTSGASPENLFALVAIARIE
jgi:hypothetical protein